MSHKSLAQNFRQKFDPTLFPMVVANGAVDAQAKVLGQLLRRALATDPELLREAAGQLVVDFSGDESPVSIRGQRFHGLRNYSAFVPGGNRLYQRVRDHYQNLLLLDGRLDTLINALADRPFSKSLHLPTGHLTPNGQVPCLMYLWLRFDRGELHLHAHWRGNDAFKKLLMNLDIMSAVHRYCCSRLGLPMGRYFHFSDSLHLYLEDAVSIEEFRAELETPRSKPLKRNTVAVG